MELEEAIILAKRVIEHRIPKYHEGSKEAIQTLIDFAKSMQLQPIETVPYDEPILLLVDGGVVQSFIYDGAVDDMFGGRQPTHWMPLPQSTKD